MAVLTPALDAMVRRERPRIVAALLRGGERLGDAEDAFQDAVIAALRTWQDLPTNPGAWLMTAARNRVRDARRHRAVAGFHVPHATSNQVDPVEDGPDRVADDLLRLLFTCCHPALSRDNQVALTLQVVLGFTTTEIARAFLTTEGTASQRLLRARRTIEDRAVPYIEPTADDLHLRADGVLGVIYAMFTEGHTAHQGALMRLDLQVEALRLARLVCDLMPECTEAFGLFALVAFGVARSSSRIDAEGRAVLLSAQDRGRWSRPLIREGLLALHGARRARGTYVLKAEIAAQHILAPTWAETDWPALVACYDALAVHDDAPLVALNRAVAVAMRDGPAAGLDALAPIASALSGNHLFYAVRADLLARADQDPREDLCRATNLATNEAEKAMLRERQALAEATARR